MDLEVGQLVEWCGGDGVGQHFLIVIGHPVYQNKRLMYNCFCLETQEQYWFYADTLGTL